jgi:hypothetical protein
MIGDVAVRIAEVDSIRVERGAQRAARIARRRWHEQPLEARLGKDARVGDAIECHAAPVTEVRQPRLALKPARDVDKDVF